MKKILFFLVLLLVYFSSSLEVVLAQEAPTAEVLAATSQAKKVDYALPYPGILPDNPLYFLKTLRDRIIKFLISDPVKKADFDLLTSDKRLAASAYLLKKKNKQQLAIDTISKSTNYFSESLNKVKEAVTIGKNLNDLPQRLNLAFIKHDEVLTELENSADNATRALFISEHKRFILLEDDVKMLVGKSQ